MGFKATMTNRCLANNRHSRFIQKWNFFGRNGSHYTLKKHFWVSYLVAYLILSYRNYKSECLSKLCDLIQKQCLLHNGSNVSLKYYMKKSKNSTFSVMGNILKRCQSQCFLKWTLKISFLKDTSIYAHPLLLEKCFRPLMFRNPFCQVKAN